MPIATLHLLDARGVELSYDGYRPAVVELREPAETLDVGFPKNTGGPVSAAFLRVEYADGCAETVELRWDAIIGPHDLPEVHVRLPIPRSVS